jgi:hypothetical protein
MVMLHIYLIPSAAERIYKQTKLHTIVIFHPKGRADKHEVIGIYLVV